MYNEHVCRTKDPVRHTCTMYTCDSVNATVNMYATAYKYAMHVSSCKHRLSSGWGGVWDLQMTTNRNIWRHYKIMVISCYAISFKEYGQPMNELF